ncbi:thioesterase family protein [Robiginitalea sp. M366]|uniref:acyl-CoA thioesterase n=1 Tax=Robiginitalea aestuariiviva TaxID=3036903 RepID=UPI00240E0191|nr:thioesterase family protein [Robiginitalea aestuariiviva]MDG1571652.1 thioesterase family protein [Robiginitalea aestuariiviva]
MYLKPFEVRWSDLDANRHMANSAYITFMSHTRMAFLQEHGFGHKTLVDHHLGPVVFYEHMYYFREVLPGVPVRVSLEVQGLSADGMFFEFHHNFYDDKGTHLAHCEMMGGWIDLDTRKLTGLPQDLLERFEALEKGDAFKTLTREDTRRYFKRPKDLV